MTHNPDILIIGGGINGVSIAYQLAKQGSQVTLLEKDFIAAGPTGFSSAVIRQHYSNKITARMALESLRVWQNFDDEVGGDAGFTETGFLMAVQPDDVADLKTNLAMLQSVGIDTKFVTPQEIKELEPHINTTGLAGAAYEREGGNCSPSEAANAYAKAAQRHGATIKTGVTVTKITHHAGKITGVETTDGSYAAENVIVAAGPWSTSLIAKLGIVLPITAARAQIAHFRRPPEFTTHGIWADFITQIYLRPETGGDMLVGSIDPKEIEDVVKDPDNFNNKASIDMLVEYADQTALRFPIMERGELSSNYASIYDITPDWHQILDEMPGYEGLFVCAGGSGHGFKLAPAVSVMMADMVLNGKTPQGDINLFSFSRFSTDKDVQGQYNFKIIG